MKHAVVLLLSFCFLNSVFAQWQPAGATSGPIYYNGGNVGIGTTSPAYLFDVNGAIHTNYRYEVDQVANSMGLWIRGAANSPSSAVFQSNKGNDAAFWIGSNGSNLMIGGHGGSLPTVGVINCTIDNTVGINTTNTAGYTLAVAGTAVFNGVTVTTFSSNNPKATPWADYVFDKNYQLPSLQSVAVYIAANHHLAGIPTAAEVQKNGLDLGANQAKLLEKIEELTLYTIQLQQQLDSLQKANAKFADLQGRLEKLETRIQ